MEDDVKTTPLFWGFGLELTRRGHIINTLQFGPWCNVLAEIVEELKEDNKYWEQDNFKALLKVKGPCCT